MNAFLHAFDVALSGLKAVFFGAALVAGALCTLEWAVRTRRVNAFSRLGRLSRVFRPMMQPVERQVIRAGGNPASAMWWTLCGIIVVGILVLSLLGLVRDEIGGVMMAFHGGVRGVARQLVVWACDVFYIAIIFRVFASMFQLNEFGPFVRWSFVVTEPVLRPLRKFMVYGMIDFSPIGAWLLLSWIIEPIVLRLI